MILSINPGSSSFKYKLFDTSLNVVSEDDLALDQNTGSCSLAIEKMFKFLEADFSEIEKVAVRVVHGGPNNKEVAQINDKILAEIEKYKPLAPLHNPLALSIIKSLEGKLDQNKIYAVFDTGYFNSLPEEASCYPIGPTETSIEIRRYGFHGISHKFMQSEADPENEKKVVTIHLGAGCSISAIKNGKVLATSMGLTPDEGLVMQTRSGDLDPGLILYLADELGIPETKKLIEEKSGLAGLTGTSGSMIDVLLLAGEDVTGADSALKYEKTYENTKKSMLALDIYVNKIIQYIGGYAALMGGLNTIAFSGKIGFNSATIRDKVMNSLEFLGNVEVKVVETDEELAMAKLVIK